MSIGKFNRGSKEINYFDQSINLNSICEIIVGPSSQQEINYKEISRLLADLGLNSHVIKSEIPLEL